MSVFCSMDWGSMGGKLSGLSSAVTVIQRAELAVNVSQRWREICRSSLLTLRSGALSYFNRAVPTLPV